jgi:hypothetical protein
LKGACSDALGERHVIDDPLELAHFAEVFLAGTWIRPADEYLKTIADSLQGIEKGLETVAKQLYDARTKDDGG